MPAIRHRGRFRSDTDETDDASTETLEKMVRQVGNRIYFHAPVSRESIMMLIRRIEEAEVAAFAARNTHMVLYIHSEGGDAHAGLSGMNHVQNARLPITTVADGLVASAGTFLLLGGRRRLAMPHSVILIHQLSTAFWGKYAELVDEMKNSQQLMKTLSQLYRKKTRLNKKRVRSLLKKELTMTARECVNNGIVDGFVKSDE